MSNSHYSIPHLSQVSAGFLSNYVKYRQIGRGIDGFSKKKLVNIAIIQGGMHDNDKSDKKIG